MKYFTLDELTFSHTASSLNIPNYPQSDQIRNIVALTDNVLDPLREAWGRPIYVNSGFRCSRLNKVVGGASGSQHLTGEAADITAGNSNDNRALFRLIQSLSLPFDQLIDEKHYKWIHVSHSTHPRRQILHKA